MGSAPSKAKVKKLAASFVFNVIAGESFLLSHKSSIVHEEIIQREKKGDTQFFKDLIYRAIAQGNTILIVEKLIQFLGVEKTLNFVDQCGCDFATKKFLLEQSEHVVRLDSIKPLVLSALNRKIGSQEELDYFLAYADKKYDAPCLIRLSNYFDSLKESFGKNPIYIQAKAKLNAFINKDGGLLSFPKQEELSFSGAAQSTQTVVGFGIPVPEKQSSQSASTLSIDLLVNSQVSAYAEELAKNKKSKENAKAEERKSVVSKIKIDMAEVQSKIDSTKQLIKSKNERSVLVSQAKTYLDARTTLKKGFSFGETARLATAYVPSIARGFMNWMLNRLGVPSLPKCIKKQAEFIAAQSAIKENEAKYNELCVLPKYKHLTSAGVSEIFETSLKNEKQLLEHDLTKDSAKLRLYEIKLKLFTESSCENAVFKTAATDTAGVSHHPSPVSTSQALVPACGG